MLLLIWHNPPGQRRLVLGFGWEDYLCLLFGGLLFAVSWAMVEARRLETENQLRLSLRPVDNMPIVVNLDVMLAKRKMRSRELAERIGITEQNLSLLKSGKVRGVRFATLAAICHALQCQPGDLLEFVASTDAGC